MFYGRATRFCCTFLCRRCTDTTWNCLCRRCQGVFTWENSYRREYHTGMTFWFRIAFTWWLGHFISRYLKVHFILIKYTCDSKSQTLRMRHPFQSTGRPISHRNGWSFRVYMIPLRDFVPEWNSRHGTTTGVNSRRGDSRRHDILWWYHLTKYRAMRGKRIELAPTKLPQFHLNTPLLKLPSNLAAEPTRLNFCQNCVTKRKRALGTRELVGPFSCSVISFDSL